MNRGELIKELSEKYNLDPQFAADFVIHFFDSIKQALNDGGRVELRGFGSFAVKNYESYTGRNPKTGIQVEVKPKKLPFFRPGRELKEYLNRK
ncbi:HU family DNA-binding protein [Desulfovibrio sp. TomC]|uniref:HU family DNA-binding protein n=1 Tax=Desulfovibrio sp. TomC TaxID=1562888 RepID=UPI00057597EB|nr:HU family DNA-binding protein [Desulfovibrio sp. TomC]KHK01685.1 Integration host factor beta subunit [Desulfovibrio sp. TomC]